MSGLTRVVQSTNKLKVGQFKYVHNLTIGGTIQGLDKNMEVATCSIEAVGQFGIGSVFGNYTEAHFILDTLNDAVFSHGPVGKREIVDKYAVLTSCPIGLDESGVGFTAVDSDFLGDEPLVWSDYVLIYQAIINIVQQTGPFVFSPSTYTSMGKVK